MTEMEGLTQMLNELECRMLVTILVPSKRSDRQEWDCIRVNADVNPRWYRNFCSQHPSSREIRRGKFDTRIRRANILSTLRRLIAHGPQKSKYDAELRGIAQRIARAA